jgi:hypothetical protein
MSVSVSSVGYLCGPPARSAAQLLSIISDTRVLKLGSSLQIVPAAAHAMLQQANSADFCTMVRSVENP